MPCMMNQYLAAQISRLTPDLNPAALESTLASLLVPGDIRDHRLDACCNRLQDRFNLFASTCPVSPWREGLVITPEIRCQTELYLPLEEVRAAFRYLLHRACRYRPFFPAVPVFSALSWADALERITPTVDSFNPARIIAEVSADQVLRRKFLAALFIPGRYGGGFDRYPLQRRFLGNWLSGRSTRGIAVLDAACGSGEGVYELAAMAAETGFHPGSTLVHGCTVEPLELAAAAHGWFPHAPERDRSVKAMIAAVSQRGWLGSVSFFRDDICCPAEDSGRYDVVVCNGLLGGPLLHESSTLDAAVAGLVRRVKKGGILLAADRFHAGWRRRVPLTDLKLLCAKHGIGCIDLPEGFGGIRT